MSTRVRFAPSPTGLMHIGGIRTALLNFIFAAQKKGSFIIRIEDTDSSRDFDPQAKKILSDLEWLGLTYHEGPFIGGAFGPYYQSERSSLYQEKLLILQKKELVYRCFCSPHTLETKRVQALALKMAPRYDRVCLSLTDEQINNLLSCATPFIWRFKIPEGTITIQDMAHGQMHFDAKNFADFPLTRADGSFTFLFSNAVDDILMNISHVLRGADHLTNTASQALIYAALDATLPLFWHLPILCTVQGKKLSKRDFGFALHHLQDDGFLPEAIINYVATLGSSYQEEIMSLETLAEKYNFEKISSAGNIRYDVDKLRWMNHQWLQRYELSKLMTLVTPLIKQAYTEAEHENIQQLESLVSIVQPEMITLQDIVPCSAFYFKEPSITLESLHDHIAPNQRSAINKLIDYIIERINDPAHAIKAAQQEAKKYNVMPKTLFSCLRLALTGSLKGPTLVQIITLLGAQKSIQRLERCKTV